MKDFLKWFFGPPTKLVVRHNLTTLQICTSCFATRTHVMAILTSRYNLDNGEIVEEVSKDPCPTNPGHVHVIFEVRPL